MAFRGKRKTLHGAFANLADADRKAESRGGYVLKRKIRGKRRFIVVTENKR